MASQERGLEVSAAWSLCFKEAYYSFSETIYDSLPHVSICRAWKIDASNLTITLTRTITQYELTSRSNENHFSI